MERTKIHKLMEKKQIFGAWITIISGGIISVFFALALIGFLVSPGKLKNLPAGMATMLFLCGGIWLIRRGIGTLGKYRNEKAWEETPQAVKVTSDTSIKTVKPEDTAPKQIRTCKSCGAIGTADESGCCEYCGAPLE